MRVLGLARDLALALMGLALLILPFVVSSRAKGAEALPGPILAVVTEVVDGDTVWVKARIWIGQDVTTKVRLAGIDAPEISRPRAKCAAEIAKGEEARAYLQSLIGGREVSLHEVVPDKFGNRVDARIVLVEQRVKIDVSSRMVEKNLAVAWGEASPWCPSV